MSSDLKVLTFTTIFPNAEFPLHGLFVRERVRALAGLCDLRVVAPVPWVPRVEWLPERYHRYGLVPACETQGALQVLHPRFSVIPKVLKSWDGALMAAACRRSLRALRPQFSFDVIDAHWACPDGVAAVLLARHFRVPVCLTVRGDDINVFARELGRRQAIRWALRRADKVVALSQELKAEVEGLGVPAAQIAVVPNGIDGSRFKPADRAAARQRLGLSEPGRYLLSVGRLHTSKNIAALVDALGSLSGEFADVRLIIVGGPDSEADATPSIVAAMTRHNIGARVLLVGVQTPDQLADWYNACDLFCLATLREGSANVLIEALACGLPCVATAVGGNSDVLSDSEVGILVPPEPSAIADGIRVALHRTWDRQRVAASACQRTWHVVAQECHAQLSAIVAKRRFPPHGIARASRNEVGA